MHSIHMLVQIIVMVLISYENYGFAIHEFNKLIQPVIRIRKFWTLVTQWKTTS